MRDVLYLAWRYLAYHRLKTIVLILSITLIVYLPLGLKVVLDRSAESLTARAEATPLLVGAKGSPLELVLNSLYFASATPPRTRYDEVLRVAETGLALAIPLYPRFRARGSRIVGTSLDYFGFRGLNPADDGRLFAMLGECVVGARVARSWGVRVGDSIVSSPETVFDLAGVYPLKMPVVGVLEPSQTPDDDAIFVDVKTAWVIEGLAHGHEDLSRPEAAPRVLKQEGNVFVGNASVVEFNEITPENVDSFHFHGDPGSFPVTAVLAVPDDEKSGALLQGRYLGEEETVQAARPVEIMSDLLGTILTIRGYVTFGILLVGLSTAATTVLVFLLSFRIRRREIETLHKIGGSRRRVAWILGSEVAGVLVVSVVLVAILVLMTTWAAPWVVRAVVSGGG